MGSSTLVGPLPYELGFAPWDVKRTDNAARESTLLLPVLVGWGNGRRVVECGMTSRQGGFSQRKHGCWPGRPRPRRTLASSAAFAGPMFRLSLLTVFLSGHLTVGSWVAPKASQAATPPPLRASHGIVASDSPDASAVGVQVLKNGGNAADAACAVALALGVANPYASGIGGGGFALVYTAKTGKVEVLDFREVAPAGVSASDFRPDGKVDPNLSRRGGWPSAFLARSKAWRPWSKGTAVAGFPSVWPQPAVWQHAVLSPRPG